MGMWDLAEIEKGWAKLQFICEKSIGRKKK
jgi:hypothetical protein